MNHDQDREDTSSGDDCTEEGRDMITTLSTKYNSECETHTEEHQENSAVSDDKGKVEVGTENTDVCVHVTWVTKYDGESCTSHTSDRTHYGITFKGKHEPKGNRHISKTNSKGCQNISDVITKGWSARVALLYENSKGSY